MELVMQSPDFFEDPGMRLIMEFLRTINTTDEFKGDTSFVLSVKDIQKWEVLMNPLFYQTGNPSEQKANPVTQLFKDSEDHHRYKSFVAYGGKMFYIAENKDQIAEYILTTKPKTVIKYDSQNNSL